MLLTSGCSFVWGDELEGCHNNPPTHWDKTFTHILAEDMGLEYSCLATCGASNHKIFRDLINWFSGIQPSCAYKNATPKDTTHMVVLWSDLSRNELPYEIEESKLGHYHYANKRYDNITQYNARTVQPVKYFEERIKRTISENHRLVDNNYRRLCIQFLPYMLSIQELCKANDIQLIQGNFHASNWRKFLAIVKSCEGNELMSEYDIALKLMLGKLDDHSRIGMGKYQCFNTFTNDSKFPERQLNLFNHPNEVAHKDYAKYLHTIFKEDISG